MCVYVCVCVDDIRSQTRGGALERVQIFYCS